MLNAAGRIGASAKANLKANTADSPSGSLCLLAARVGAGQHSAAESLFDSDVAVKSQHPHYRRLEQVAIDYHHALSRPSKRAGQVQGHRRAPLARLGGGDPPSLDAPSA